jgi:hypothetical protein
VCVNYSGILHSLAHPTEGAMFALLLSLPLDPCFIRSMEAAARRKA